MRNSWLFTLLLLFPLAFATTGCVVEDESGPIEDVVEEVDDVDVDVAD